ncbi:MAG: Flp pilus assembly complex ATPase component TadA [Acidimicrobiia bacterium]|nr:Flp pilus assembly complex ATPase component TadA [Acidimicrobiia bacterium]
MSGDTRHLGALLLEEGLLTADQLEAAVDSQQESGLPLGQVLIEQGIVTEAQLVRALGDQIGVPFIDLGEEGVDPAAVAVVPDYLIKRYTLLPVAFDNGRLVVAMADPANVLAVDDLRAVSGYEIIPRVATRSELEDAIRRQATFEESVSDLAELAAEENETDDLDGLSVAAEDAPVVKLVNTIVTRAVNERASDIHLEPGESELRVRFRIDGVLHDVMSAPRSISKAVVSRVKIMADLNIAERRVPQDGRISLRVTNRPIDLRAATLPGIFGEKVVLRILDKSTGVASLPDLGFSEFNLTRYESAYRKPYGAILVTGPTGSGKTTTLYSTLDILNKPDVNIITVEDPVEYRLPGITQVQVNRKAGLFFATALKSILRADPDIILIGEVRDSETAQIAVESALTGHLVLTTLHTNDAPSSIGRLLDMGVEPFLAGSSVDAVLAQRLARRLCDRCKTSYEPDKESLVALGWTDEMGYDVSLFRPEGCGACSQTGYKGRLSINEVMLVNEEIQRLIVDRASADRIASAARNEGMVSLREDGLAKVKAGLTSVQEILRVVA